MMLELIIASIALLLAIVALFINIKRNHKQNNANYDVVLALFEEYSRRMNKLETRLVDLQVRLDIIETRIEKPTLHSDVEEVKKIKSFNNVISQKPQIDITKFSKGLSEFELAVLRCVAEGAKTPSEVKAVVGHTREHVARALKDLYEEGFLFRQGGRPFIYSLSDKGRAVLSGDSRA